MNGDDRENNFGHGKQNFAMMVAAMKTDRSKELELLRLTSSGQPMHSQASI
jgi:hypothetical protein